MTADELKAWFSAGREVLGFIRDAIATHKEIRELKKAAEEKKEKKPDDEK